MTTINEIILEVCTFLNIKKPKIVIAPNKMITDTMLALFQSNTIYLKNKIVDLDTIFAVVHELRHVWQLKPENKKRFFSNYKERTEIDLLQYNKQLAEIDANAFASIVMIELCNRMPLYQGMDPEVVELIKARMREISQEN